MPRPAISAPPSSVSTVESVKPTFTLVSFSSLVRTTKPPGWLEFPEVIPQSPSFGQTPSAKLGFGESKRAKIAKINAVNPVNNKFLTNFISGKSWRHIFGEFQQVCHQLSLRLCQSGPLWR